MVTALARDKKNTGFGKRLRELRLAAGLTQQQLGDKAEMPYQNIARFERGERQPTWPTVIELAEALNVSPDAFLDADGDADAAPPEKPVPKRPKK